MKKVICSFTWSPGEKSQLILDGCPRVKQTGGVLRGGERAPGWLVSQRGWLALSLLASVCRGTAAPPSSNCLLSLPGLSLPAAPLLAAPAAVSSCRGQGPLRPLGVVGWLCHTACPWCSFPCASPGLWGKGAGLTLGLLTCATEAPSPACAEPPVALLAVGAEPLPQPELLGSPLCSPRCCLPLAVTPPEPFPCQN